MPDSSNIFDFTDLPVMPDLTIQSKNAPVKVNKDYLLDRYKAQNPIIYYSAQEVLKGVQDAPQTDYKPFMLSDKQIDYIEFLLSDMTDNERILEITPAEIVIWKRQNKLFAYIINIIKEAQADKLESEMWEAASKADNKDSITKMFLLKARKQEYKDNAPPPPMQAINLRISIEGESIDTSLTAHKPVYDVLEDTE